MYVHAYTYARTHTHTTHTCTYTHTHTYTRMHTHTRIHTHARTRTPHLYLNIFPAYRTHYRSHILCICCRAYDPAEFDHLPVANDLKELFQHIRRYTPQNIELDLKLKPFIPEYIPAIGDIDAFIKVRTYVKNYICSTYVVLLCLYVPVRATVKEYAEYYIIA